MIATGDSAYHEEARLLLPWLANGRLSPAERERVEEHVRVCPACTEELAFQRLMCKALTEPDRVTYAPGPSFRKLLDRIDATTQRPREANKAAAPRSRAARNASITLWRPPGLAWAASFVLAIGLAGIVSTVYRWSEPRYTTVTDAARVTPNVLHIAFDHSLTIGEVEQLLRSDGAQVVEGPGSTGIFGVTSVAVASGQATGPNASREMQVLSARLRADPRVRWVEPIAMGDSSDNEPAPPHRGP
jgi:hypothetical protein